MARSYNRTNYGDLELFEGNYSKGELRKIVNNIAATANARIKALRKEDDTVQMFSDMAEIYNRLLKKHPEFFTKDGNLKRSLGKTASEQQLETFIDEVAQIVLSKTGKQTKKDMEESGLSTNKIKHLIKVHGKDKVVDAIGEAAVKRAEKRPSDEDEDIDWSEIFDESGNIIDDEETTTGVEQYDAPIGPRRIEDLSKDELIDIIMRGRR